MRTMAEKAIQLDPLLAEAHAALGSMYARSGEWAEAEQSFRRAIQIDPNGSIVRADYAYWVLAVEGRLDEALTELRLAKRTDPLSPRIHRTLAMVLTYVGRYDEAAEYLRQPPQQRSSAWPWCGTVKAERARWRTCWSAIPR